MRLLIDTDAFCKLAVGRVLSDAIRLLGGRESDCGRLPALVPMLRRGRLRKAFGPTNCDSLIPIAEVLPILPDPTEVWLGRLISMTAIDPGEARIFASAAEHGLVVVSGDKRALRALKNVDPFPQALASRIVVLEAILLALCEDLGTHQIRQRVQNLISLDQVVNVCFRSEVLDPQEGLRAYFEQLVTEVAPLALWNPWLRSTT